MEEDYVDKQSVVIVNSVQFSEYTLYLTGPIGSPSNYMDHFSALKMANEGDVVVFHINTPGGDLGTATMMIEHIKACPARVIGVIGIECASAGSAIMLAMDEIRVSELSTVLIHNFSYSVGGSASSVYNHADFNVRLNERWIRATYGDFLPEDKILRVLDGVDVLLDSDQIIEYWNNRDADGSAHISDEILRVLETPVCDHWETDTGNICVLLKFSTEEWSKIKDYKKLSILLDN